LGGRKTYRFMQVVKPNSLKFVVASLFCAVRWLFGAPALAESSEGYLTDSAGKPVRSYSGECVHTYAWREGFRFADCGPAPAP
jgi:hypothetical protein